MQGCGEISLALSGALRLLGGGRCFIVVVVDGFVIGGGNGVMAVGELVVGGSGLGSEGRLARDMGMGVLGLDVVLGCVG